MTDKSANMKPTQSSQSELTSNASALPILIAHRGGVVDEERSENSFRALEEAIRRGYTHVEIDARITADGHVICFHEDELMEEAGIDGKISEMTRDAVTDVILIRSQETIPTFNEYCDRCAGRIGVMIDLKGCRDEYISSYADEVESALDRHDLLTDALILINKTPRNNQDRIASLFEGKSLVSWRRDLATTREAVKRDPDVLKRHYVFNHGEDFTAEDVSGFRELGFKVIPGINSYHYPEGDSLSLGRQHIEYLRNCEVDGFQIDSCYDPILL